MKCVALKDAEDQVCTMVENHGRAVSDWGETYSWDCRWQTVKERNSVCRQTDDKQLVHMWHSVSDNSAFTLRKCDSVKKLCFFTIFSPSSLTSFKKLLILFNNILLDLYPKGIIQNMKSCMGKNICQVSIRRNQTVQ